jgi:tRNA nucleotidyltransferase (CCA-adding enzyme)
LKLPPGPQIGQLLEALQIAQAEGKISTSEEALQFAQVLADAAKLQP